MQGFLDRFRPLRGLPCVMCVVVVVFVVPGVWWCPCHHFISKGARVIGKVPRLVTIIVLVGLYLWGLFCHHLVVMWVYADPYMGLVSCLNHVPWVCILDSNQLGNATSMGL
jgi:hypothetical protein